MSNINKKKNLYKIKSLLFAYVLFMQSLAAEAKIQDKDLILAETYEEFKDGNEIETGITRYESDDEELITQISEYVEDTKLGDIVEVFGRGKASSLGTGNSTKEYKGEENMVVVGIKSTNPYPYAIAPIYEDGSLGEVIGWFKKENILSRETTTKKVKHGDVIREVINATQTSIYYNEEKKAWEPELSIPDNQDYEWLGEKQAVKLYYEMPEIPQPYDYYYYGSYNEEEKKMEIICVYNNQEYKYYYYSDLGVLSYSDVKRNQVDPELILKRNYGIKNK